MSLIKLEEFVWEWMKEHGEPAGHSDLHGPTNLDELRELQRNVTSVLGICLSPPA